MATLWDHRGPKGGKTVSVSRESALTGPHIILKRALVLCCTAGKLFRSQRFCGARVSFDPLLRSRIRDCDSHHVVFEEEGTLRGGSSCLSPNTNYQCMVTTETVTGIKYFPQDGHGMPCFICLISLNSRNSPVR